MTFESIELLSNKVKLNILFNKGAIKPIKLNIDKISDSGFAKENL